MIKNYLSALLILVTISGGSIVSADSSPSAQQALDQLRILQRRLGSNPLPPEPTKDDGDKSKKNPAQGVVRPSVMARTPTQIVADTSANKLADSMAFEAVTNHLFPLSPEEVHTIKKLYQKNEMAQVAAVGTPPKPTATSQFVNLSPGSTPPAIRLAQGFVSSLVFLDSTGAPWPISAYDLGDPAAFNIVWDKVGNTLMIQANKLYTYGNLAVRLSGLNTPVMLTLIPGQKAVDYRVDLRIQGIGPNAKALPLEEGIPPSTNDLLLHVLDGVPPPGSDRLVVSGGDARAWIFDERMYVRTNLTILSPGWIGSMTSADGMHAYEMQKSPVLLVSWHGKVMQLKIEGL
jgi:intracellular multiplication protein IcmK